MKARIINSPYEIEVIPFYQEGWFVGFTDVSNGAQPGLVIYKPSDLETLDKPEPIKSEPDWDAFRREAAKDILCEILHNEGIFPHYNNEHDRDRKEQIQDAIMYADELIKQLKESHAREND